MVLMLSRTEFEEGSIKLFHGTDADYDVVDWSKLATPDDKCANCALGLWLTPDEKMAASFGSKVLTVEMPTDGIAVVPLRELRKLYDHSRFDEDGGFARHAAFSADLRRKGKSLVIVLEGDGEWGTAVAIDPRVAVIVDSRPSDALSTSPRF